MKTNQQQELSPSDWYQKRETRRKHAKNIAASIQYIILAIGTASLFYNWQIAIVFLAWLLMNSFVYDKACSWMCIDEYDTEDPQLGLKLMLKSWKIQIPMLGIAAVLILINCPVFAVIYGIIAFMIFIIVNDILLFDF